MAASFERSVAKLKEDVSINQIAGFLTRGRVDLVLQLFPLAEIRDSLTPAAKIVEDAFYRGGRMAADDVNEQTD